MLILILFIKKSNTKRTPIPKIINAQIGKFIFSKLTKKFANFHITISTTMKNMLFIGISINFLSSKKQSSTAYGAKKTIYGRTVMKFGIIIKPTIDEAMLAKIPPR